MHKPWLVVLCVCSACVSGGSGPGEQGSAGACGNGVIEDGEECDAGALNADDALCTTTCHLSRCGDGLLMATEACDDGPGNADLADICRTDCTLPRCGDSIKDTGEQCDLGAANSNSADAICSLHCMLPNCGDGTLNEGEECDLGANNSDAPNASCSLECRLLSCGNGAVDAGEECDAGPDNSLTPNAPCRPDCTVPKCGDGVVDGHEQCDDGDQNSDTPDACRTDCTSPRCGDDIVDGSEECDEGVNNGPQAACTDICLAAVCGDGFVGPNEECDDGDQNADSPNACRPNCALPFCGDGVVDSGEACEPSTAGPQHATCTSGCALQCATNWADTDNDGSTGCETDLLTTPEHCGRVDHDCGGGACINGTCLPVQIAELQAHGLTLKYSEGKLVAGFASVGGGGIINGGQMFIVESAARSIVEARTVNIGPYGPGWTIHDGTVYGLLYSTDSAAEPFGYVFGSASLTTEAVTTILPVGLASAPFTGVSAGHYLYWPAATARGTAGDDEVRRYAFGGMSTMSHATLRATPAGSIASFDPIAINSNDLFVATTNPSQVWRIALDPDHTSPTALVTTASPLTALAASETAVVGLGAEGVIQIPANCTGDTCGYKVLASTHGSSCAVLLVDGEYAYWSERTCSPANYTEATPIYRMHLQPNAVVETVADGTTAVAVSQVVVANGYVYWVQTADPANPEKLWKLAL